MLQTQHSTCESNAASEAETRQAKRACGNVPDRLDAPPHEIEHAANIRLVKSALSTRRGSGIGQDERRTGKESAPTERQSSPDGSASAGLPMKDIDRLREYAIAENTRKNYEAQWGRFVGWARSKDVRELPAEPKVVAAYLAERFEKQRHKPATLRLAASAIGYFHRMARLHNPVESYDVRSVLSGATRKAGGIQKQAEGLTERDLDAIKKTACEPRRGRGGLREKESTARRRGEVDISMVSLMRDGLLRVSEAAALKYGDLEALEDGTGRLLIRRSKTDQEGETATAFISRSTMEAIERIRNGASDEDSVFGLSRNQIANRIKQAARSAGLGDGFSGHSPRVGMAMDLARDGCELPRLMAAGRWRSPMMPAHYTRNESAARGAVAQYHAAREGRLRE